MCLGLLSHAEAVAMRKSSVGSILPCLVDLYDVTVRTLGTMRLAMYSTMCGGHAYYDRMT